MREQSVAVTDRINKCPGVMTDLRQQGEELGAGVGGVDHLLSVKKKKQHTKHVKYTHTHTHKHIDIDIRVAQYC